jgi:hypothetical protein
MMLGTTIMIIITIIMTSMISSVSSFITIRTRTIGRTTARTRVGTNVVDSDDNDDYHDDNDDNDDDDGSTARSQFGTKYYWDELYQGRGDFPSDEYQWYYGWDGIKPIVQQYYTNRNKIRNKSNDRNVRGSDSRNNNNDDDDVLVLGIGNDPILLDLLQAGYTKLTATDYSSHAIERQQDLLDFSGYGDNYVSVVADADDEVVVVADDDGVNVDDGQQQSIPASSSSAAAATTTTATARIHLLQMDARKMDPDWSGRFDLVLEKGCLDAVYLSGDGNIERVEQELFRTLKNDATFISVSGVVPDDVRRTVFSTDRWTWLRDGTDDLKAGCFVLTPRK